MYYLNIAVGKLFIDALPVIYNYRLCPWLGEHNTYVYNSYLVYIGECERGTIDVWAEVTKKCYWTEWV